MQDQTGEIAAHDLTNKMTQNGRLVTKAGMSVDETRERLIEAGYMTEDQDIFELIRQNEDTPVFSVADVSETTARAEAEEAEREQVRDEETLTDIRDEARQSGVSLTDAEARAAATLVRAEGYEPARAIEDVLERSGLVIEEGERAGEERLDEAQVPFPDVETAVPPADVVADPTPGFPVTTPQRISERAGSINLERLDTPEQIKDVIAHAALQHDDFTTARRGVVTWEQTEQEAKELGLTVDQYVNRRMGEAPYNAAFALAGRELELAAAETFYALTQEFKNNPSHENQVQAEMAYHKFIAITEAAAGNATEAGRTLNIYRKLARASKGSKADAIKQFVEAGGGKYTADEVIEHINNLDMEEIPLFLKGIKGATTMEMVREAWYMALLSGPATQGVNIASNALVSLWTIPEHLAAGLIGKLHGGEKVYLQEALARSYGWTVGHKMGLHAAHKAWVTEEPSVGQKLEYTKRRAIPSKKFRKGKVKKKIAGIPIPFTGEVEIGGKQLRAPGRALIAGDEYFKALSFFQKAYELAAFDGIKAGKKGKALAEHVKNFVGNLPESAKEEARKAARVQTFTEQLGPAGQALMTLREKLPGSWVVIPFIQTPTNILKWSIKRTPLPLVSAAVNMGEVNAQLRAGGRERDIALGRMAFGSGVMALVAAYASEGLFTGQGPDDPRERSLLRAQGWQPYSIKIGDKYYSYAFYEPLGILFGLASDYAAIRKAYPKIATEKEWGELTNMVVAAFTNNMTNKIYMRGVTEIIRAVDDPQRYGNKYVAGIAATVVPTGVAQMARLNDPVVREIRGVLDTFKARIPGLRKTLPVMLNPFGEEIASEGAFGPDIASRIYTSQIRDDPAIKELIRLDVGPGRLDRKIRGVKLNNDQYIEYVKMARQSAKRILDNFVNGDLWPVLSDYARRKLAKRIFDDTSEVAREEMLTRHPELLGETIHKKIKEITE